MAENNGGYKAVNFGYTDDRAYSNRPAITRLICLASVGELYGTRRLINSGGADGVVHY